jgi:hypothetical protein
MPSRYRASFASGSVFSLRKGDMTVRVTRFAIVKPPRRAVRSLATSAGLALAFLAATQTNTDAAYNPGSFSAVVVHSDPSLQPHDNDTTGAPGYLDRDLALAILETVMRGDGKDVAANLADLLSGNRPELWPLHRSQARRGGHRSAASSRSAVSRSPIRAAAATVRATARK